MGAIALDGLDLCYLLESRGLGYTHERKKKAASRKAAQLSFVRSERTSDASNPTNLCR